MEELFRDYLLNYSFSSLHKNQDHEFYWFDIYYNEGKYVGTIVQSPTDNCQLNCIGSAEYMLEIIESNVYRLNNNIGNTELNNLVWKIFIHSLKKVIEKCHRPLMLIDIHQQIANKYIDQPQILMMNNYTNSNGSQMSLGIINLNN